MSGTGEREETGETRRAERPGEIPLAGLMQVARRVWVEIGRDNVPLLSAGVAFYGLLAIFPGLIALVTLYGLIANPEEVFRQVRSLAGVVPPETVGLLDEQAREIVGDDKTGLGLGFAASVLGVLWSASSGALGLIRAVNAAYDVTESRSFVRQRALAFGFTLGIIGFVLFAVGAVAVVPGVLRFVGLGAHAELMISTLRWPVLALAMLGGLVLVYRYGPSRPAAGWRWVSWGSLVATALWLGASALFSWYVEGFGRFNQVYGSLGAVIVLLLWFFLGAFAVLLGAEINAELERQEVK